ncbi:McrBC 5-methylcytosine restriction system component [Devosia soli]|uniref:McrBC 5-methylcytosine restriction system component n=1 Tax=Devosia soli TaxID=361041 RepID=A0A0F5LDP2_9HYPH|nr:McrBC 5-methylcytosine restriction system component [Devosia soli]KKB79712.1 McrBC 5-methylcytosine restriction system component [Devosia soli]
MTSYLVREWETLPHGEGAGCIPERHATRLVEIAKGSSLSGRGGSGVLEDRRRDLRARGVVGVLAAPECTLEILPKIDVANDASSDAQTAAIRKRLVHMLAVALNLKVETGRITELDWQRETLLEILIRIYCEKLTQAVRGGIPRQYVGREDDLAALRGTLNVVRQFTVNAANPALLGCRFDELSDDISLNRIMKACVTHLSKMSRTAANQQRLRELAFVYAEIADVPTPALRWADVLIDRTNRQWQDLFAMAQLFLRDKYQNTSGGSGQGTALLFEMNDLFEEYVGRLIARALAGTDYRVTLQGGLRYCLTALDSERAVFQTKPDILIWHGREVVHVLDTKWKRISARIDDPKQGVSQADVYQMMAYAHVYKSPILTLLYPHHDGLADREGIQAQFKVTGHDTVLQTASVDVGTTEGIIERLQQIVRPSTDTASRVN